MQFIEKTIETWRVELTAWGKSLAAVKIQGNALSQLSFVIVTMSFNHIIRKYTVRYKLSRSQEKIDHLMYMDDIKEFAKNEGEL